MAAIPNENSELGRMSVENIQFRISLKGGLLRTSCSAKFSSFDGEGYLELEKRKEILIE